MTEPETPALLVLTTVHVADDTRIREKLIRTVGEVATITYATRSPAPSDRSGIAAWIELRGGRVRRNVAAAVLLFSSRFRARVIHDPELLPAAILAAVVARRRVVVDVHEHVPAQLLTKAWLPRPLRKPAAWIAARLLRIAERTCDITLAEPGYQVLFCHPQRVFANYPDDLPEPADPDGSVVYIGDVTEARGSTDLAAAVASLEPPPPLRIIGRCSADLAAELRAIAPHAELLGRIPHPDAMEMIRHATVGVSPLRDLPNYRYSLPTKVIEYLGTGIAVVATDLPGTREVIEGCAGVTLVPPQDVPSLSEAIDGALRDRSQRRDATASAADVRARFRWPREDVVSFYRDVLA